MQFAAANQLIRWRHTDTEDAKREIFDAVGDLSGFRLTGSQILIGVYLRPVAGLGGIIRTQKATMEDFYQGKTGLIVRVGPDCTTELPASFDHVTDRDERAKLEREMDSHKALAASFGGRLPTVGDWIMVKSSDTEQLHVRGPGAFIRQDRHELQDWDKLSPWPCWLGYLADIRAVLDDPAMVV